MSSSRKRKQKEEHDSDEAEEDNGGDDDDNELLLKQPTTTTAVNLCVDADGNEDEDDDEDDDDDGGEKEEEMETSVAEETTIVKTKTTPTKLKCLKCSRSARKGMCTDRQCNSTRYSVLKKNQKFIHLFHFPNNKPNIFKLDQGLPVVLYCCMCTKYWLEKSKLSFLFCCHFFFLLT